MSTGKTNNSAFICNEMFCNL